MIEIKATARRKFLFPANVPQALQFYSDFPRITQYLPHISLVQSHKDDLPNDNDSPYHDSPNFGRYRVLYATTELGAYQVHIFADVETEIDTAAKTLYVRPSNTITPIKSKTTLRSLTAPGSYNSRSIFRDVGDECEVTFIMELSAVLPRPSGLRFMPNAVLNRIADSITNHRMNEIISGFISQSIQAFSH